MYKKTIFILLLPLFLNYIFAQETLTGFEEKDLPVLNEELRDSRERIEDTEGDISDLEDGEGQVLVSANDTTLDELDSKLVAGTNISLTENNDGGNETLTVAVTATGSTFSQSNLLWSFGLADQVAFDAVDNRPPDSGDTPTSAFWQQAGTSYIICIRSKFVKLASIDTVTHYHYVESSSNTHAVSVQTTVGGQASVAVTPSSHGTEQWISNTIDVSGLTDNTVYDVTIELKNAGAAEASAIYYTVGFGS